MDKTDYMQHYKQITQKISKKRFLRKPNVAEAADEFQAISKSLARQECPSYSAFFQLAKARCEHTLANAAGETEALTEAARQFFKAELDCKTLNSPTFDENLNASINCYAHAVRIHIENRQPVAQKPLRLLAAFHGSSLLAALLASLHTTTPRSKILCRHGFLGHYRTAHASALCVELGDNLERVGKPEEAVNHFIRAAELQALNPIDRLQALRRVADCKLGLKDYEGALNALTDITKIALEYGCASNAPDGRRCKPVGFYYDLCQQAELEQLLLLLLIRPISARLNPEHAALLEKYTWELEPDSSSTYLDLEDFLLLQSVVMASQAKDFDALQTLQSEAYPRWKPPQNELMFEICQRKQGDGYGGGLFDGL